MHYIAYFLFFMLIACSGERPENLGISNHKLQPCPNTPNCVSSESIDEAHKIAPLASNLDDIKKLLSTMDQVSIQVDQDNYLYAEFTSAIMGFVDDVEFYYSPTENRVHVRSASRLGKSDLGVNRQRIEDIRSALNPK